MPPLTVMIKPASSYCNMHCSYCFYADEAANRSTASFGIMSEKTLEILVKKSLSFADRHCTFAFQGGEPTLAGLGFYKTLIKLEKKYNRKNLSIENIIQTNGYAITETWARFLSDNHFFLGISLDGPQPIHDTFRKTSDGKGTHARIVQAISLLRKHHVEFNILTVVTPSIARRPFEVYSYYKANLLNFQQYIPCLAPLAADGEKPDYILTPELYGAFLINLFDLWHSDLKKGNFVYISFFEDLLGIIKGFPPSSCTLCPTCQKQYVIEADGGVYPCDFYALDDYKLGNILTDSFPSIDSTRKEIQFIEKSSSLPITCSYCKWRALCNSGCRRERENGKGQLGHNHFCAAYKAFFEHAYPRLLELS